MFVSYAVEGETDAPVAERLIRLVGGTPRPVLVAGGKSKLDPKIDFARNFWDPTRAAERSPSLRRAIDKITTLVADGSWA